MNKRTEWTFTYQASRVLDYARAKETFHKERVTFWTQEWEKAQKAATRAGRANLKAADVLVAQMATYNAQQGRSLDEQHAEGRVFLAKHKVEEHKRAAEEVGQYVRALALHPAAALELSVEDMAYFRIGYDEAEDDDE